MIYPKHLFSINETRTQENIREYERKRKYWYTVAETMFPDYWKKGLRERYSLRARINEAVGFSI